jgi:hypothetical protein
MRFSISILGVIASAVLCLVSCAINYRFGASLSHNDVDSQLLGIASVCGAVLNAILPSLIRELRAQRQIWPALAGVILWCVVFAYTLTSAHGFVSLNDTSGIQAAAVHSTDARAANELHAPVPQERAETRTAILDSDAPQVSALASVSGQLVGWVKTAVSVMVALVSDKGDLVVALGSPLSFYVAMSMWGWPAKPERPLSVQLAELSARVSAQSAQLDKITAQSNNRTMDRTDIQTDNQTGVGMDGQDRRVVRDKASGHTPVKLSTRPSVHPMVQTNYTDNHARPKTAGQSAGTAEQSDNADRIMQPTAVRASIRLSTQDGRLSQRLDKAMIEALLRQGGSFNGPSKTLAEMTGFSKSTVCKWLNEADRKGVVSRDARAGRGTSVKLLTTNWH